MVMHLAAPGACSLQMVTDVVAERQHGVNATYFNGIVAEWQQRVRDYILHHGSPEFVPTWPAIMPHRASFLSLYVSPARGSVQRPVLENMRKSHGLNYCPSCGEPGKPNTLDHYLPKTLYPHFCVTPLNLFPMCDACQDLKGIKTGNAANPRFFIHPYYDVFVANQVVELAIQPPYATPTFTLRSRQGLTPEQTGLVDCHLRELEIERRFSDYFVEQYLRLLRHVNSLRHTGQNVRAVLRGFRDAVAPSGANVWDHVFYAAAIADAGLMNYLEHDPLPAFL
jgi:hypothetical protein